jgi:hypothetical protein
MEKQRNFFALWSTIIEATGDQDDHHDPFWELCDGIFKEEYSDSKEATKWFEEELAKIGDDKLREQVRLAAEDRANQMKYFYLVMGFTLAQDYDVSNREVREQVEYLRKRIRESGIFPLTVKPRRR